MNEHFLFFILDMTSWIIIAYMFGKFVNIVQKTPVKKRVQTHLILMPIAFGIGLLATLINGIPHKQFAWENFIVVVFLTYTFSYLLFPKFRKLLLLKSQHVRTTLSLPIPLRKANKKTLAS